jgi:hypothetical protein
MHYLTHAAKIKCTRCPGTVSPNGAGDRLFTINGRPVLAAEDLEGASVSGCTQAGPGITPCSQVVSVLVGRSEDVLANGCTPVLENLLVMTNGVPPTMCQASDHGDSLAEVGAGTAAGSAAACARPPSSPAERAKGSWVEIELTGPTGQPAGGEWYRLILADGGEIDGVLGDDGRGRVEEIPEKPSWVMFPGLPENAWRPTDREAAAAGAYTAVAGDNLSAVAGRFKTAGWESIWEDSRNQAHRERRKNPDNLQVGDVLFIPGLRHVEQCRPGTINRFRSLEPTITVLDAAGRPLACRPFSLMWEGQEIVVGTLDEAGRAWVPERDWPAEHPRLEVICRDGSDYRPLPDYQPGTNPLARLGPGFPIRPTLPVPAGQTLPDGLDPGLMDDIKWFYGLVIGDFNEEQTLSQILTGAVIGLFPVVDQVMDLRDVSAAVYKLVVQGRTDEPGVWFDLVVTAIGCIPTLGSAAKGVIRIANDTRTAKHLTKMLEWLVTVGVGDARAWLHGLAPLLERSERLIRGKVEELFARLLTALAPLGYLASSVERVRQRVRALQARAGQEVEGVLARIRTKLAEALRESAEGVHSAARGKSTVIGGAAGRALSRGRRFNRRFARQMLDTITAKPDHALRFLIGDKWANIAADPRHPLRKVLGESTFRELAEDAAHPLRRYIESRAGNWLFRKTDVSQLKQFGDVHLPGVQVGHGTSDWSRLHGPHAGAPEAERLFIEDATANWFDGFDERKWVAFEKQGVVIDGVHVERSTALMYERLGLLPQPVSSYPPSSGWIPP